MYNKWGKDKFFSTSFLYRTVSMIPYTLYHIQRWTIKEIVGELTWVVAKEMQVNKMTF